MCAGTGGVQTQAVKPGVHITGISEGLFLPQPAEGGSQKISAVLLALPFGLLAFRTVRE
jgi:hypothetical protein